MKIATPIITDFDKEDIAPWAGNRLIDLHMATLPSKPITRFFLNHKQKKSLSYQKLRPRYEPMDEITQTACEPLCPEGWYFDCATETCKQYSRYVIMPTTIVYTLTKWEYEWRYEGDYYNIHRGIGTGNFVSVLTGTKAQSREHPLIAIFNVKTPFGDLIERGTSEHKIGTFVDNTTYIINYPNEFEGIGHEIWVEAGTYDSAFNLPPIPTGVLLENCAAWVLSANAVVTFDVYGVK